MKLWVLGDGACIAIGIGMGLFFGALRHLNDNGNKSPGMVGAGSALMSLSCTRLFCVRRYKARSADHGAEVAEDIRLRSLTGSRVDNAQ